MTTAERSPAILRLPLDSGDRLTRDEFERRYATRDDIKRAELIEGVVYVSSPVRIPQHAEPHGYVDFWLVGYKAKHSNVRVADNGTVRLDADNEPQPDAMLFLGSDDGGQSTVDDDGYLEGAPELVVEIAASSASYDLGPKMSVYRRNGVKEYIVWQMLEGRIDWFQLERGVYVPLEANDEGIIESGVFPGLRLDVAAMLRGDLSRVVAALG